ncbi:hypothetical protein DFH06DRAFT_1325201 [Mycena polygramma]|nr:hypothetical protein DFH06DRAFT_1325201 [Mycena polygramma]
MTPAPDTKTPTLRKSKSRKRHNNFQLDVQPFKSKFRSDPTDFELEARRLADRREKARIRMAQKRAELKERPHAEQVAAAERAREHQAAYRERSDLRDHEALRRLRLYEKKFGVKAYAAYLKKRRRNRIAKAAKAKAKAGLDYD